LPTISGLRRRGYTPKSIRDFCDKVGVARRDATHDVGLLEYSVRQDLNMTSRRVFVVLDPIKLTITNYPEDKTEEMPAPINPENLKEGNRLITFCRELLIERDDFMEDPSKKFYRLGPDRVVRLKYGYIIKCLDYIKDSDGKVEEIICEYYPESKSGQDESGIKVKSAIHWLSSKYSKNLEVRLYDRLFNQEKPDGDKEIDFKEYINVNSLRIIENAKMEAMENLKPGNHYQFERKGYFVVDPDSSVELPVFNRTVELRDSWAKISKNN